MQSFVGIDGAEIVRERLPAWAEPIREEYFRAGRVKRKHFRIWELRKIARWSWQKIVDLLEMDRDHLRRVVRQVDRRIREIFWREGAAAG